MYVCGSYRESVTRYNHKNTSRWMVPSRPARQVTAGDLLEKATILFAGGALIAVAVMILGAM